MAVQLRVSRWAYRLSLVIAVAAAFSGFNATLARFLWAFALIGILSALALTPPASFGLIACAVAAVVLLTWVLRLPHWANVVAGIVVATAWVWMYVIRPTSHKAGR